MAHPIVEKIKRVPPIVWFVVGGVVLAVLFLRFGGGGSSSQVMSGQGISGGGGGGNDFGTGESDIEPGGFGIIESILEGQAQQIADLGELVGQNATADAEFRTSLTDQLNKAAPVAPTPTPAPKPTPSAVPTPVVPHNAPNLNLRPLASITPSVLSGATSSIRSTAPPAIKQIVSTPTAKAPKAPQIVRAVRSIKPGKKPLADPIRKKASTSRVTAA